MNIKRVTILGSTVVVLLGGLAWASSSTPQEKQFMPKLEKKYAKVGKKAKPMMATVIGPEQDMQLTLVPPPQELPRAGSRAMVTSVAPVAPVTPLPMVPFQGTQRTLKFPEVKPTKAANVRKIVSTQSKVGVAPAKAVAQKPDLLFSYIRLLNFSPHPQEEVFLKDKPMVLKDNKYHFAVKYLENWTLDSDEDGHLNTLGFEINIMQDDKAVRTLKIPATNIHPKKIKKGQVLGIAEVAPYKFMIAVDSFTLNKKGVTDITFRMDLTQ